ISPLQPEILIVDSGSTDRTLEIAKEYGARVLYNPWKNHSAQLNWAIEHLESDALWVARLDADEYLTSELALELTHVLSSLPDEYSGLLVKRRVFFLGRWMKHGGYYPIWLLRFWRQGKANCEERWMDEHLALVDGTAYKLANDIVDRNMKGLTFWIDKHNHY